MLAAELRPAAHVVKLMRCRNIYLQSTVHQPPRSRVEDLESKVQELSAKVKELSILTARAVERDPDLDALNRKSLLLWLFMQLTSVNRCCQAV